MRKSSLLLFFIGFPLFLFSQTLQNTLTTQVEMDSAKIIDYIEWADSLKRIGEYQGSLDLLHRINLKQAPISDSLKAIVWYIIGIANYQLERNEKAAIAFQASIQLRKHYNDNDTRFSVAKGYHNIGNCYHNIKLFDLAAKAFEQAIEIHSSLGKEERQAKSSKNCGRVYTEMGNINKAKVKLYHALRFYRKSGLTNRLQDNYAHLIRFYTLHQNTDSLLYYAHKALELENLVSVDDETTANVYNNLAIAYELIDSLKLAESYYHKALTLQREDTTNENTSKYYNNLAIVYRKMNQLDKAITYIDTAIVLNKKNKKKYLLAINYNNKANSLMIRKEYTKVLLLRDSAIVHFVPNYQLGNPFKLPVVSNTLINDKLDLIYILNQKMETHIKLGDNLNLSTAMATADSISVLLDNLRRSYSSDISKGFLANRGKLVYENAIEAVDELYQTFLENKEYQKADEMLDKAFTFFEKSKAIILLEAVKKSETQLAAGELGKLVERERFLKRAIKKIEQSPVHDKLTHQKYRDYTRQLDQIIDTFGIVNPRYKALFYPRMVTVEQVRKQILASDQALIEYFIGDENLYVIYISNTEKRMLKIPLKVDLLQEVIALRNAMRNGSVVAANTYLYDLLIAPLEKTLDNPLPERLVFIPDEILGLLDFGTLVVPENRRKSPVIFFEYYHPISYCYSASMLDQMIQMKNNTSHSGVLAVAPNYSASHFSYLNFNKQEAQKAVDVFGGTLLSDSTASSAAFIDQVKRFSYQILLISAHAKANDQYPDSSFIAFTSTDQKDLLFLSSLYDNIKPLNADLVILSACETGVGKIEKGEGVISFARGIAYGQVKSMIMTLGNINDQIASQINEVFFEKLKSGLPKDKALWEAKKEAMERENIARWSGSILVGDTSPLVNCPCPYRLLFLVFTLLVLISISWKRIKKISTAIFSKS